MKINPAQSKNCTHRIVPQLIGVMVMQESDCVIISKSGWNAKKKLKKSIISVNK